MSAVFEKTTYHSIISHFFLSLLDCPTSLSLFTSYAVFEKTPYPIIINHFSLSFLDCPTSLSPFLTLLGTHLSDRYLSVTKSSSTFVTFILSGLSSQSEVRHPPMPKNRSRWPWMVSYRCEHKRERQHEPHQPIFWHTSVFGWTLIVTSTFCPEGPLHPLCSSGMTPHYRVSGPSSLGQIASESLFHF